MKKLVKFLVVSVFVLSSMAISCDPPPPPDPNQGFFVRVTANGIQTGADLQGFYLSGNSTSGTVSSFPRTTLNGFGFTQIGGARVPGTWRLTYDPGFNPGGSLCLGVLTADRSVSLGSQETLPCVPRFFSFTASPDAINAFSPPATIDVTGNGADTLYGTPMIAFYDEFGNVIASGPANQLLYDNGAVSGVRINISDVSQAYDGTYTGLVHNVNADGSWEVVGAAAITIYGNPPPPPPPPPDDGGCEPAPPDQPQLECEPLIN